MSTSQDPLPFGDVLEAVERLTPEEQQDLATILQHRLADRGRKQLVSDVQETRREFTSGGCLPTTADDLMGEILS